MPNLEKFTPLFEIIEDGESRPARANQLTCVHRRIQVYGESAVLAFQAGDSHQSPAKTFVIDAELYAQFQEVAWTDYDPVLCYPPANAFYVRPTSAVTVVASDFELGIASVMLDGFFAYTIGKGDWLVSEILLGESDSGAGSVQVGTETVVRLNEDKVWNPSDRSTGAAAFSICGPNIVLNNELPYVDCQKAARQLVSFLYLINSNRTSIASRHQAPPKNRSERRQRERESVGTVLDLKVSPGLLLNDLFERMHAGECLGPAIAGAVRTELKHRKYPDVRFVRSSSRYEELERIMKQPKKTVS